MTWAGEEKDESGGGRTQEKRWQTKLTCIIHLSWYQPLPPTPAGNERATAKNIGRASPPTAVKTWAISLVIRFRNAVAWSIARKCLQDWKLKSSLPGAERTESFQCGDASSKPIPTSFDMPVRHRDWAATYVVP